MGLRNLLPDGFQDWQSQEKAAFLLVHRLRKVEMTELRENLVVAERVKHWARWETPVMFLERLVACQGSLELSREKSDLFPTPRAYQTDRKRWPRGRAEKEIALRRPLHRHLRPHLHHCPLGSEPAWLDWRVAIGRHLETAEPVHCRQLAVALALGGRGSSMGRKPEFQTDCLVD